MVLAQTLLGAKAVGNEVMGSRVLKVTSNIQDGLIFALELRVFSTLRPMHHAFDTEHISKLFVAIQRLVDWLQSLN